MLSPSYDFKIFLQKISGKTAGVATFPTPGENAGIVLQAADMALYQTSRVEEHAIVCCKSNGPTDLRFSEEPVSIDSLESFSYNPETVWTIPKQ